MVWLCCNVSNYTIKKFQMNWKSICFPKLMVLKSISLLLKSFAIALTHISFLLPNMRYKAHVNWIIWGFCSIWLDGEYRNMTTFWEQHRKNATPFFFFLHSSFQVSEFFLIHCSINASRCTTPCNILINNRQMTITKKSC